MKTAIERLQKSKRILEEEIDDASGRAIQAEDQAIRWRSKIEEWRKEIAEIDAAIAHLNGAQTVTV